MPTNTQEKFFTYKGLPLVRKGDVLYYGNMFDDYVIMLTILEKEKNGDIEVATRVRVQMLSTDPNTPASEMVVKSSEQKGLYDALDIGQIWLSRNK